MNKFRPPAFSIVSTDSVRAWNRLFDTTRVCILNAGKHGVGYCTFSNGLSGNGVDSHGQSEVFQIVEEHPKTKKLLQSNALQKRDVNAGKPYSSRLLTT